MSDSIKLARDSRILIVKLSSIGDVVMATPVAKALRQAFPEAYISWVVESKSKEVVLGNPYVDEVIIWERRSRPGWSPGTLCTIARSLRELGRELQKRNFDVAIDFQGLLRSALVTKVSGAPIRIGYDNGREGSTMFYTDKLPSHRNKGIRGPQIYLNLLQMVGIQSEDIDMHVEIDAADRASMQDLIAREADGTRFAALCPATTWPHKHWTEDGWAAAADLLSEEHGLTPVFMGSPADQALISRIRERMARPAVVAAGKTTLKQAAALLDLSSLVVGVDSGLLHTALALDKPAVGIFGPTAWRHFARKDSFVPVAKDFSCAPCLRHPTCTEYDCMKAVTPRDILDAANHLIGAPAQEACPDRSNNLPNTNAALVHDAGERKLKTVHIETGMHSLGGPAQVVYLMSGLKCLGHEATLICPTGSTVADNARAAGLDVITLPLPSDLDLTFVPRLCRIIKQIKPDIVHLHSRRGADVLGGLAARLAGAPAIVLSRRIDNPIRRGLLSNLKYGTLCDRIIAVSNGVKDALVTGGVDPNKITCVHSVAEAKRYQKRGKEAEVRAEFGLSEDTNVIAIIAQLIERKGHRFLFQAMPRILEQFPNTVVLVLGEGQIEGNLRELAESLGIKDKIIFAGFRNNIGELLSVTTVLVHPATMEGFANCVLQAMAAEVPVVVTAVGGMPESVHDGVNGFLVPPQDPDAIADAVIKLLADPDLRARMGRDGREIVEDKFCPERMVEGVVSVYRSIMDCRERQ